MRKSDLSVDRLAATAVAVLICVAPAGVWAQTDPARGLYIGGGIGQSDATDGCDVSGTVLSNCDTDGTAWKAYGGYQINKWLGAELSYLKFADVDTSGTASGVPFSATTETWGIGAHAVGQIPIPLDVAVLNKISILGKIGAVRWDQDRNSSLAALSGDDTGWTFAWGFGLQYTFSERLGLRAEWEQFNDVGDASTGESNIQMWNVGLNFKF